jgi:hypothetical protein
MEDLNESWTGRKRRGTSIHMVSAGYVSTAATWQCACACACACVSRGTANWNCAHWRNLNMEPHVSKAVREGSQSLVRSVGLLTSLVSSLFTLGNLWRHGTFTKPPSPRTWLLLGWTFDSNEGPPVVPWGGVWPPYLSYISARSALHPSRRGTFAWILRYLVNNHHDIF